MQPFLIKLFFIFNIAFQGLASGKLPYELEAWKRLLYIEDGKPKAHHHNFYVSIYNDFSLKDEWQLSIKAIKEDLKVGREKKHFACSFPARYSFITKFKPELKKKIHCPDLLEWKNIIDFKDLYLVYASSYLTNPASMFGHTFLRLSRGHKDVSDTLREYTTGFLAITNPNDNPLFYAIKGITGNYLGHFEVKPFYMSVGLYQNAEARDLWQYKVQLPENKKEFFINHLWEVSQQSAFRYFFFDENCSYYILKLLEAVMPSWNLTNKNYLFAHPIETLKWTKSKLKISQDNYLPGINKTIRNNLKIMTSLERTLFQNAKKDLSLINSINSPIVLDTLLEYWKFENYKAQAKLPIKDKQLFRQTLLQRARLKDISSDSTLKPDLKESPHSFHDPNRLEISSNLKVLKNLRLNWALGYHNFHDPKLGHDNYSYIDYLGFTLNYDDKLSLENLNLVTIQSLSPFTIYTPNLSWKLDINFYDSLLSKNEDEYRIETSFGLMPVFDSFSSYLLFGARAFKISNSYIRPLIELGIKKDLSDFTLSLISKGIYDQRDYRFETQARLTYLVKSNLKFFLSFEAIKHIESDDQIFLGMTLNH